MNRIISDYYNSGHVRPIAPPTGWQPPSAANGIPPYIVKGPHQRRMTRACLEKTLDILDSNKSSILNHQHRNFEELYNTVREEIIEIRGIGNLTVYDICMELGRYYTPWIMPKDYVYVAQGALVGARKLLGKACVAKYLEDGVRLPITLFSNLFPNIPAGHIEDMLCVYKEYFAQGRADKKACRNLQSGGCRASGSATRKSRANGGCGSSLK